MNFKLSLYFKISKTRNEFMIEGRSRRGDEEPTSAMEKEGEGGGWLVLI